MAGLNAEEGAPELNQNKKRPRKEVTGDEHEEEEAEGNKRSRAELAAEETCCHEHTEESEGKKKKCSCTELPPEETREQEEEKKKMKTRTRKRYPPEYVDYILSWNGDWEILQLPIGDEVTEEVRSMHVYAMKFWTQLRARKRALQEFVRVQVADRGYAELPEDAADAPKEHDDDGEELFYLGFGIYDG